MLPTRRRERVAQKFTDGSPAKLDSMGPAQGNIEKIVKMEEEFLENRSAAARVLTCPWMLSAPCHRS